MKTFHEFTGIGVTEEATRSVVVSQAKAAALRIIARLSELHREALADKSSSASDRRISEQDLLIASLCSIQIGVDADDPAFIGRVRVP